MLVIPGGVGNTEQQVEAIARLRPAWLCRHAGFPENPARYAQSKAGKDASSIKRALVSGAALPPSLRQELAARGVEVLQCYAIAETGVIAYETPVAGRAAWSTRTSLSRSCVPAPAIRCPEGEVGEVVVTSFNPDYPMIRLATGDLSAVLPGRSPCGRTNMRIKGWMGRRRPDGQGEGHVRAAGADGRRSQAPPRTRSRPSRRHARGRTGCDDASCRNRFAAMRASPITVAATLQSRHQARRAR